MNTTTRSIVFTALTLGVSSVAAAQTTINFNGASDTFTSQFTGAPGWQNNVGILDQPGPAVGGGLRTFSNPTAVFNTGISTASISSFTVSGLVRGDWVNIGSGSGAFTLGFGTATTAGTNFTGTGTGNSFGLRIEGTSTAGSPVWRTRLDTASANITPTSGSTAISGLLSTNWYLVSATYTKGVSDVWNFSGSITDYGTNGNTPAGSPLSSVAGSFTQASTYGAATLHAAINFRSGGGNQTALDNFTFSTTAIPEPSSFAVIAGLGALGFVAARRRRA
ncbi:MAG: PEP-CTERM sorting domain-containing protein [Opitutaceae bacterium]|jgi:hypothetical protein|nr:PEP-CTERM sorting domain-containing protein [Opitutaceae bacterium]